MNAMLVMKYEITVRRSRFVYILGGLALVRIEYPLNPALVQILLIMYE